jgi:acyl-coenzyme A synthetase/AMP-(fatty) acid ligase
VASAWQQAARNSILHNIYGPTEATVAFTKFRWSPGVQELTGDVSIGEPFTGLHAVAVTDLLRPVNPGEMGELCLAGAQVARGYWRNEAASRARFVSLPGSDCVWYRTGDLVEYIPRSGFNFKGRVDHQVKVRGYRVELQEVEHCVRQVTGARLVAVVPWPVSETEGVLGLVAFTTPTAVTADNIIARCGKSLPPYMRPDRVITVRQFPLNANGKVDRKALVDLLASELPREPVHGSSHTGRAADRPDETRGRPMQAEFT